MSGMCLGFLVTFFNSVVFQSDETKCLFSTQEIKSH